MNEPLRHQSGPLRALAALWDGGRFPHLLIIEGALGSGRRTLAMRAVAMLLCRAVEDVPCGECPSCRKLKSGNHPDLTVVEGDKKSKSIGVERIRQLRAEAYLAPHESQRRVFFIPDAQNLTFQAQNALLKLVEEPPESDYFVFTLTGRTGVLETLRSRAATVTMQELTETQRLSVLRELRGQAQTAELARAAQSAATVGQALSMLEDARAQARASDAQALFDGALRCDRYELMRIFSQYEKDRDEFLLLISSLRTVCIASLTTQKLPVGQCVRMVGSLEETAAAASQNVGLPLLSAVTAEKLVCAGIRQTTPCRAKTEELLWQR